MARVDLDERKIDFELLGGAAQRRRHKMSRRKPKRYR